MIENPSSNAGNTGLIPGWGTKIPHASGQLGLYVHAATREKTTHHNEELTHAATTT